MDNQSMPQPVEGQIVHVEIACSAIELARKFYGDVFGWTFKDWGDTSRYQLFMDASGKLGGGFTTELQNSGAGGILFYIYTADIEAKLVQAESHGGRTLTPKSEIPQVGHYAVVVDPFGNHIGLFSS